MFGLACYCRPPAAGGDFCYLAITIVLLLSAPRVSLSATLASDSASDAAYAANASGAWDGLNPTEGENLPGTDNGGFGFGAWDFTGGFQQPRYSPYGNLNHFIDGVDFAASSFNDLSAPAFGLTNSNFDSSACQPLNCPFGGETARATRTFLQPLAVGNTISWEFDNPASLTPALPLDKRWFPTGLIMRLNAGSGPAIDGSSGVERFALFASTGLYGDLTYAHEWFIDDAGSIGGNGVPTPTGIPLTTTASGAKLSFTLLGPETYSVQLTRTSDGMLIYSHSGNLAVAGAGAIDTLEISLYGNGSGNGATDATASPTGERELFLNGFAINSPLTGDYNLDGVVDAADYVVWRDTLGQSVPKGSGADGDGSGDVGSNDYMVWKTHFGESSPASAAIAAPEPAARNLACLAWGMLWAQFSRRRRGFSLDRAGARLKMVGPSLDERR